MRDSSLRTTMGLMLTVRHQDLGRDKEGAKHPVGRLEGRVRRGQTNLMTIENAASLMVSVFEC